MKWKFFSAFILEAYLAIAAFATSGGMPFSAESLQVPSSVSDPKDYGEHAAYLLVLCMDFRLRDEVEKFMELYVGKDTYDEIVLPGASLGTLNDQYPHWGKTFEQASWCYQCHIFRSPGLWGL